MQHPGSTHPNPNGDATRRPHGQTFASDLEKLAVDLQATAASQLARILPANRLLAPSADDQARVWAVITENLSAAERRRVLDGLGALSQRAREHVIQQVFDALLRLGPLQRYLSDPDVEEVLVNGATSAFVIRAGGQKREILTGFGSEAEVRAFASRTVAGLGRRLDEASPAVDARLPDGSRLHVITPPLAPFTCLTIRRDRLAARSLTDLIQRGTLSPGVAGLLAAAVRAGLNLVISGGTATGKTTMLNALAAEIDADRERVVTLEETRELDLLQRDVIALEARFGNVEGQGAITLRELTRHALRMRPTRIILGEARGPEALDMVTAMNSGHAGSMGTLHASSARQALSKLRLYIMWAEAGLSSEVVTEMIADTIDWVIHLDLQPDGRRVVAEVAEVSGIEHGREQLLINHLTTLDPHHRPVLTGLRPQAAERLLATGWRGWAAEHG